MEQILCQGPGLVRCIIGLNANLRSAGRGCREKSTTLPFSVLHLVDEMFLACVCPWAPSGGISPFPGAVAPLNSAGLATEFNERYSCTLLNMALFVTRHFYDLWIFENILGTANKLSAIFLLRRVGTWIGCTLTALPSLMVRGCLM